MATPDTREKGMSIMGQNEKRQRKCRTNPKMGFKPFLFLSLHYWTILFLFTGVPLLFKLLYFLNNLTSAWIIKHQIKKKGTLVSAFRGFFR